MLIRVYSTRPSRGARILSQACKGRRVGVKKVIEKDHKKLLVVNWGSSERPPWLYGRMLNKPEAVSVAVHKTACLEVLTKHKVPCLEYTTDQKVAKAWGEKERVIARTILTGHSGNGIVVVEPGQEIPSARLFTRYYPKTHEFRVHVFGGKVIDFAQKKSRQDAVVNRTVRTHDNGWVYAHEEIVLTPADRDAIEVSCTNAIKHLGLDFGAVDVLARLRQKPDKEGNRRLLDFRIAEVNTAPGLENTVTINAYSTAIKEISNG